MFALHMFSHFFGVKKNKMQLQLQLFYKNVANNTLKFLAA